MAGKGFHADKYYEARWSTWERSDCMCYWCGVELTEENFTLEHIVAHSAGGDKYKDHNLAIACSPCNHRKKNTDYPESIVGPLRKWFAFLYRTTDLVEKRDVDGILKIGREVFKITTGRGTIITLFSLPPGTKEQQLHERFKCHKPLREPIQLEHSYPPCQTQPPLPTKPIETISTQTCQTGMS